LLLTQTVTTEELELLTSCNSDITYFSKRPLTGLFFYAMMSLVSNESNYSYLPCSITISFYDEPHEACQDH